MFAVHVKGAFFAAQAVVPLMKRRRRGKIVNISSIWGMVGHHYASPYCGAKAALLGLTKAWAKELAPWNIHVNAVAPGGVLTEMVLAQPDIEAKMPGKVEPRAARPLRRAAGDRLRGRLPRLARGRFHHRPGDQPERRRGHRRHLTRPRVGRHALTLCIGY